MPAKEKAEILRKSISNKLVDKTGEIIQIPENKSSGKAISTDSFYHKRLDPLGVTEENNKIMLWQNDINNKNSHENILVEFPVFKEVEEGIEIPIYTLDRLPITYSKEGTKSKKKFSIQRLEKPVTRADGSVMKYKLPKGAGTHPFFPPALVDRYDKKT